MSRLRILALGLLAVAGSCRSREPAVRVEVRAIPRATATIEARFTLGGRSATAPAQFVAPAGGFHEVESFVVDLPVGTTGALAVVISGSDAAGCVTGGNEGTLADVTAGKMLPLPLLTEGRAGCLLTVDVPDGAHGQVDFDGVACPGICTRLVPSGSVVPLTATASADGAFLAWSGDCVGDDACAPLVDRPRHVGARFTARGLAFARAFGGTDDDDRAYGVSFDPLGNLYVVGTFGSTTLLTSSGPDNPIPPIANAGVRTINDGYVTKLDQTGRVLWTKSLGGPFGDDIQGVATLGDQVYLAGSIGGAATFDGTTPFTANRNVVVLVLSSDGQLRASRILESPLPQVAGKLLVAPDGSLFVAGATLQPGRVDGFVYALRPDLSTAAVLPFGGTLSADNDVSISGLSFDEGGGVVLSGLFYATVDFAGQSRTSAGGQDGYVMALTSDLHRRWVTTFGGTAHDHANGIARIPGGGLVVAGEFGDTVQIGDRTLVTNGNIDGFVAKLDSVTGTPSGAISFGTANYDGADAVAVADNGTIAVAGFIDFTVPDLETDLFVTWLDASLNTLRSERFNGKAYGNFTTSVAMRRGSTVVAGHFARVTSPGGRPLASHGSLDGFVARWSAWP